MGGYSRDAEDEVARQVRRDDLTEEQRAYWDRMQSKVDQSHGDGPLRGLLRGFFGGGDGNDATAEG